MSRRFRVALLPVLWLAFLALALRSGRDPGYWGAFDPATYYPWREVARLCLVLTIETVAVIAVLRPWSYERHWRRAAVAFAGMAPVALWEAATSYTDQPGYHYVNFHFTWLLVLGLLVLTIRSFTATRGSAIVSRAP